MAANELRALLGAPIYESAFSFAVVRNPYDRLVSIYNFLRVRRRLRHAVNTKAHARAAAWSFSFGGFVRRALRHGDEWQFLFSQWQYTGDSDMNLLVDRVLRFEEFEEELSALSRERGWPAPDFGLLARQNASRECDYRDFYSTRLRREVAGALEDDCELFGYSF